MRKTSPKTERCQHCSRLFTKKGLKEHLRHVKCSPSSTAVPKKFQRARCKYCSKTFHSGNSLRVHVAGQHPTEYARSPNSVKDHRSPRKQRSTESPADQTRQHSHGKERGSPKKSGAQHASRAAHSLRHDANASAARASAEAERSRRVWEEALRRQQVQMESLRSRK